MGESGRELGTEGRAVAAPLSTGVIEALMSGEHWADFAGLLQRPEWQSRAACRGMGTEVFFGRGRGAARRAIEVCATCPVAEQCRAAAVEAREVGVWGGATEEQRRQGRRAAAA